MTDSAVLMKLKPVLDLAAAEELLLEVRRQVDGADEVHFDASEVRTMTTPGIEIIMADKKGNPGVAVVSLSP
jgi:hypothetical protein